MGLREEIESTFRRIALDVRIAGNPVPVVGVDTSSGLSQKNAQATIHMLNRPSYAQEGAAVEIWVLINGLPCQIFGGELSGIVWSYFPGTIALDARDLLGRLRLDWGGEDREYTEIDDAALEQNLIEAMGIPSSRTHIESTGWTLAVVQAIVAASGRPFLPLIEEVDDLAGCKTYSGPDGVIYRKPVSRVAGPSPSFVYEKGVNIIDIQRRRGRDGIKNRAVVTGLTYEDLVVGGPGVAEAQATNPFVPTPPGYITDPIQSDLIEDDDKAREIAVRKVADQNRLPDGYEVTVPGNPLLQPRLTTQLIHDKVESGDANVLIDGVQHSIGGVPFRGFRTTFTTFGANLSGTTVDNVPPAIALSVVLDLEAEDTGSAVERRIVVVADASATTDPDGDETAISFDWSLTVDAGTIDPSSASGVGVNLVRALISGDATVLTIVLTATDSAGGISTITRTVPIDSSTIVIEPIYSAEGVTIAASDDGAQTWHTATLTGGATSTCLMPIAPAWGEVWG